MLGDKAAGGWGFLREGGGLCSPGCVVGISFQEIKLPAPVRGVFGAASQPENRAADFSEHRAGLSMDLERGGGCKSWHVLFSLLAAVLLGCRVHFNVQLLSIVQIRCYIVLVASHMYVCDSY